MHRHTVRAYLEALGIRFAAFVLVWLVLTGASTYQLWFGLVLAMAAAVLSVCLAPPLGRWLNAAALLRLIPFFLVQAVLGGLDVGRRALRRQRLQPTFITYPLRLRSSAGRLCLTCMVSLLPGTVACALRDGSLRIHVLDQSMDVWPTLEKLEAHTAAIFRAPESGSAIRR